MWSDPDFEDDEQHKYGKKQFDSIKTGNCFFIDGIHQRIGFRNELVANSKVGVESIKD